MPMIKQGLKAALSFFWKNACGFIACWEPDYLRVPILCYHSVNDSNNSDYDHISTSLFQDHLRFLTQNYSVIPLSTLVDALGSNSKIPNAVVLTFDDGYLDNYTHAFQSLKQYGCHATIFLATAFIEQEVSLIPDSEWNPMRWEQIREMASSGLVTFGAHTHSHSILSGLDDRQIRIEIAKSREILEAQLGTAIEYFAYPNGQGADIPPMALAFLEEFKFRAACSTFWRTGNSKKDLFLLNRVMIHGNDSVEILKRKLQGEYDYIFYLHKLKSFLSRLLFNKGIGVMRGEDRETITKNIDSLHFHEETEIPGQLHPEDTHQVIQFRYHLAGNLVTGKEVLEIGCGTGMGLGYLSKRAKKVVGGEFSAENLALLKHYFGDRFEVVGMDAHLLPFNSHSFDVVVALAMIYYLDIDKFLPEVKRVLRPQGTLFFCTSNKDVPGFVRPPYTTEYFSVPELCAKLLQHGFDNVEAFGSFKASGGSLLLRRFKACIKDFFKAVVFSLPKGQEMWRKLRHSRLGIFLPLPVEIPEADLNGELQILNKACKDRVHRVIYVKAQIGESSPTSNHSSQLPRG